MNYPFRTTYRLDADTYIEDRGYAHEVKRGDPDFEALDAEFGALLAPGQTARVAMPGMEGPTWERVQGFPLLDNMKAVKSRELNRAFYNAESNGIVQSSAGFAIDANERADRDIRGLITRLESNGETTAGFCAADNSFHEVTLENLRAMQLEIIAYGQRLYAKKWELRSAIEAARTPAELAAITISFEAA